MHFKLLGRTGVTVSELCFGTMSFGREADEDESARQYAACRDAGINFFDCANVYSMGKAEEILGRLIAHERDEIVLTSKVGMRDEPNQSGLSRRHIMMSADASLRRLGTDRLDVLFVHRFDETVPIEETLRALDDLVSTGKALYIGASNWAAWQLAKAIGVSERCGWARFDLLQPMYNLVKRQAEVELLPLAREEGIAVTPYSSVGGGMLTGKYREADATGRIRTQDLYSRRYGRDWIYDTAARFADFAEAHGFHPASLAVAWVASNPDITAPIIGARNTEQVKTAIASLDIPMTDELRNEISAMSPTPPPADDRLEVQG